MSRNRKRGRIPRTTSTPMGEVPAELVPPIVGQEIQIPMLQIPLANVTIQLQQQGEQKVLVIGPVAITFGVPLDSDVAKRLGGALIGTGIEIPSGAVVERIGATKA